jgi:hypothetical protein
MKYLSVVLSLVLIHGLVGEDAIVADPFAKLETKMSWPHSPVSKIDLSSNNSVKDAIAQIIDGLPSE